MSDQDKEKEGVSKEEERVRKRRTRDAAGDVTLENSRSWSTRWRKRQ